MTRETLRSRLAGGGTAFGTMVFEFHTLGIPRIAAAAGADFVLIDLEHTGWGVEGIRPLLAAGAARDVELLVRVQGSARHLISPSLDLGARGVMVPMVGDSIEAERVVHAARFAPDGSRGFGLLYPDQLTDGVGAAMRTAEEATVLILEIETEAGVEHVEEIAATPGVDVLWVGQFDLSIALGVPGAFGDARVRQAEDRVLAACAAAGIAAGVLVGSVEVARSMVARGFRMIALGSDIDLYAGPFVRVWRPSETRTASVDPGSMPVAEDATHRLSPQHQASTMAGAGLIPADAAEETKGNGMRDRAQTVIVGAGIVGASAAFHLAELGSTDVLVIDQGPLFETGGSTSHAPGLVFQTNGSRTMCRIAQDTVRLYGSLELDGLPGWYGVGGIEVATTPERVAELRRRRGFARSYGIDDTELLSPSEAAEKIPLLDASAILGAYFVPSDGIAKAVRIVTALARKAAARGVTFEGGVRVTGFDIRDGRVHGVETDRGPIECERVLICAGIWGPTVGALAGVPIPLVAVQHQLVWTDPIPELAEETREVVHPILRHQDHSMYFRHREDHYGVGNYRHEPIVTAQRDIRRPGDEPMPSLMPFTPEDFVTAERETERLLPVLAGHMRPADPNRSINGMFSFTPDAGSIVGESAKVRGVWLCEAVWVTHGGGMGQQVAEWMVNGEPGYDLAEADANRFYPFQTTPPYIRARGAQQYREVYDILHPLQQIAAPRKLRLTPFYDRHMALGAECFTGAGWERPQWFEANRDLLTGADWERREGWAAMNWSPAVGAEHLATRDRVALFDITPFAKFDVSGRDALVYLERICANRIDRPAGSVVYTAMLTPSGGIRCDLTVTRKDEELFRVVTGGGSGQHDLAWMRAQIRDGQRVTILERTGSLFCLGLWGPRARDVLASVTDEDVSNDAFPYLTAKYLNVGEVGPVWAQRISYAGELGWELYGQFAMGDRAWDVLWEAGRALGIVAAGSGAFDSLRLEKGYRLWGQDIHTEHDPFEAGLGFAVRMDKGDFQGRAALETILERGHSHKLACMTFDDPSVVVMGKEPIWSGDRVVSYATSANHGYSLGRGIVYGYLPVDLATEGTPVEVEYFGERHAATVAADPLVDPKGERLKA